MTDIVGPLSGFFAWYNPFTWITVIVMAVVAFVIMKYVVIHKQPKGARILGEILFTMKIGEMGRGTLYEIEDWMTEPNLDALEEIPEAREFAQFLKGNKKDTWVGLLDLKSQAGATLESGLALVFANKSMWHSEYSKDAGSYYDPFRGRIHLKMVNQALSPGRVIRNVPGIWNEQMAHVIYYPMQSFDDKEIVKVIENPHGTVVGISNIKSAVEALRNTKELEAKYKALDKNFKLATSEITRETRHAGYVEIQLGKKSPFKGVESTLGSPLSMVIVIGVIGFCAILLPDPLSRQLPGYTSQHYIGFSIAIGAAAVWLISMFRR